MSGPRAAPELVSEAELVLGAQAFYDEERTELVADGSIGEIDPAELGVRTLLYTRAIRWIAEKRWSDRQRDKPQPAESWNEEWGRKNLIYKRLAALAVEHDDEAEVLRRQLAIINNAEQFSDEYDPGASQDFKLFPDQQEVLELTKSFWQNVRPAPILSTYIQREDLLRTSFNKGSTTEAPTGSGKTVIEAGVLAMCGIGKIPEGSKRRLRALLVVPSQDLVEQFCGLSGDGTFRRWLKHLAPSATVGPFYQHDKEHLTDVVVTTIAQFIRGCHNGLFFGEEFDLLMVDEGHHATEPKFYQKLKEQWDRPILAYTATPDYDTEKDVRRVLPTLIRATGASLLGYTESGRLNGAQLFTFMIDPHKYADRYPDHDLEDRETYRKVARELLDKAALAFVVKQVQEGRRGIMFCESGGVSLHARQLAEHLSSISVPDKEGGERLIVAKAIGWFLGIKNREVIEEYHKGGIDVLLTTKKGQQGLNGAFDFVVLNNIVHARDDSTPPRSTLKIRQIVGRGTRPSKEFPLSRYAEFVTPNFDYSIWHAFGIEHIEQGYVVQSRQNRGESAPVAWNMPAEIEDYCEELDGKLVSEVCIGRGVESTVPVDYVPVSQIAAKVSRPQNYVARLLRRAGYARAGRWELTKDKRAFVQYFEPNALSYFDENPVPPLATPDMKAAAQVCSELSIGTAILEKICRQLGIALHKLADPAPPYRTKHYIAARREADIKAQIELLPSAGAGDIQVADLARELGLSTASVHRKLAALGTVAQVMWRYEGGKGPASTPHVLANDAEQLRSHVNAVPYADPSSELNKTQIKKYSGYAFSRLQNFATNAELSLGVLRRKPGRESSSNRTFKYWPKDVVDVWAERARENRPIFQAAETDISMADLSRELNVRPEVIKARLAERNSAPVLKTAEAPRKRGSQKIFHILHDDAEWLRLEYAKLNSVPVANPRIEVSAKGVQDRSGGIKFTAILKYATPEELALGYERRPQLNGNLGDRNVRTYWPIEIADRWIERYNKHVNGDVPIPMASAGDMPVGVIAEEYGVRTRRVYAILAKGGKMPVKMSRDPTDQFVKKGRGIISPHVRAEDVPWLRRMLAKEAGVAEG